jgi:hypothetical protein
MTYDAPPRKTAKSFAIPKVQALQGIAFPKISAGMLFLGLIVLYAAVCLQAALRM